MRSLIAPSSGQRLHSAGHLRGEAGGCPSQYSCDVYPKPNLHRNTSATSASLLRAPPNRIPKIHTEELGGPTLSKKPTCYSAQRRAHQSPQQMSHRQHFTSDPKKEPGAISFFWLTASWTSPKCRPFPVVAHNPVTIVATFIPISPKIFSTQDMHQAVLFEIRSTRRSNCNIDKHRDTPMDPLSADFFTELGS